jgi:predicted phage baseplate assembly protein
MAIANRPGLDALDYRVGTHAAFLETMQARLATVEVGGGDAPTLRPLAALKTRAPDDPAMALLDAWATVADVLTFYQERIANEGYLRTATERRSVLELVRLIGYELRPGVAATVYLAFTLEDGFQVTIPAGTRAQSVPGPGELPQSFETVEPLAFRWLWNALRPRLSAPVKLDPDDFRDDAVLWLAGTDTGLGLGLGDLLLIVDRVTGSRALVRVDQVDPDSGAGRTRVAVAAVPLAGATAVPAAAAGSAPAAPSPPPGDPRSIHQRLQQALEVDLHPDRFGVASAGQAAQRILRALRQLGGELAAPPRPAELAATLEAHYLPLLRAERDAARGAPFRNVRRWLDAGIAEVERARDALAAVPGPISAVDLKQELLAPPSQPPPSRLQLETSLADRFAAGGDVPVRVLAALQPALAGTLLPAWQSTSSPPSPVGVLALRVRANLFGYNVPKQVTYEADGKVKKPSEWEEWTITRADNEQPKLLYLDAAYPTIAKGSQVVIQKPPALEETTPPPPAVFTVMNVAVRPRTAYGISSTGPGITVLEVDRPWWNPPPAQGDNDDFSVIRGTSVYAAPERLAPAEAPLGQEFPDPAAPAAIPLDGLYGDLEPGRWLIVQGERLLGDPRPGQTGVAATVPGAELVMLAGVAHRLAGAGELPGETPHTTLTLATPLAYRYRRDTVVVLANVAKASHGETETEVLGSGDASAELQRFTLRRAPLTYVAAPTPSGVRTTLEVRVNGVLWHEAASLLDLGPTDRGYVDRADDKQVTTVVAGDGRHGARLPTGLENVEARYRHGIGQPGNVGAGRISLLASTPDGVRSVVNPLDATGGADPESRDSARENAPLTVTALDRLVSVRDYEDFARTFAGIGKAMATRRSDGSRQLVHVTIAGVDDAPLAPSSDTFRSLRAALRLHGDPGLPVRVALRELLLIVVQAGIGIDPDHRFDLVEPRIRAALLDAFGFARRQLGQDVVRSQVISVIQAVEGVAYVDLDVLGVVGEDDPEKILGLPEAGEQPPARIPVYPPAGPAEDTGGALVRPAQLAIVSPKVPETVLLEELR